LPYAFDPELVPYAELIPSVPLSEVIRRDGPPPDPALLAEIERRLPAYTPRREVTVEDRRVPGGSPLETSGGPHGEAPRETPGGAAGGAAGGVPVRVFRPRAEGPLPAIVYLHGGGFVSGELDYFGVRCLRLADLVPAVVVAVDYRLAPEHPYPAALDDTYATLEWLAGAAGELGVDPDRIAAAGDSAGGNLATALALLTRDRGGPPLRFQFLDVPVTDDRLATPSMRAFTDTPMWNRPDAVLSWRYYLGGDGIAPPYAAPIRAADLSGLPPAFVAVCEFDPLRDEGIAYAQRLVQDGVPTELHLYPGAFHGAAIIADVALTRRMNADMIAALRRALHPRDD
jgi:acetyl esterase